MAVSERWGRAVALCVFMLGASHAGAQNLVIYGDALAPSWSDWSYPSPGIVVNFANGAPVHAGADSVAVTFNGAFAALSLRTSPVVTGASYTSLRFWIFGGAGGTHLDVFTQATDGGAASPIQAVTGPAGVWTQVVIPLSGFGSPAQIARINLQDNTGTNQPRFYLDDVELVAAAAGATTVSVDANANARPISPLIYGVHFADTATLQDLNATVNRFGGNSTGRYNWQANIDNRGADFYFESIPYGDPTPGELGDTFIGTTKAGGAEPFLTMPMVGWVAKTNANRDVLYSFSVAKYGAQTGSDPNLPDAGNGCKLPGNVSPCANATPITPPTSDPNDASMPADAAFQQGWMQHVRDTWGPASSGGLRYWGLDNEPSIWWTVYWDVKWIGADMNELRTKMIDYGTRIKTVDPSAQVLGPEEWGWDGYFYSGKDLQLLNQGTCNGADCPDRVAHGGQDYVPYLLSQMHQHEISTGQRVLDMFTLHFYPQGGEFGNDVSPATQLLRNRSTRGLWDPTYVNESYINQVVQLIPRMRGWADTNYPGLKLGLTEYDWGAEGHVNGATTEADLLGIFGREGLDMAIRWIVPATNTPVYKAFKMYRNYDGLHSTFGDTSVSATVPNPDNLSAFAARRTSSGALTVMVVNKVLSGSTPTVVNLTRFSPSGAAQVWQLTAANAITRLADAPVVASNINVTLPAQSITLFVVPGTTTPVELQTFSIE